MGCRKVTRFRNITEWSGLNKQGIVRIAEERDGLSY